MSQEKVEEWLEGLLSRQEIVIKDEAKLSQEQTI